MEKSLIFFVDFDGTITEKDVCAAMVERFSAPGWQEINQLWEEGILSTAQCAQRTLNLMDMTPAELAAFTLEQPIDPAFIDFATWAKQQKSPIYILSDGYENYIRLILNRYQLQLPYYANKLRYRPQALAKQPAWRIEMPHHNTRCGRCGVCKSKIMLELMRPGNTSIYIGDGYSDRCPVHFADVVFAKGSLVNYCNREGIAARHYKTFRDVLKTIKSI